METSLRRARDSQRIKVYRANTGILGAPYPSMTEIEDFCIFVQSSKLWKELFPREDSSKLPILKPGRGAKTAHVIWHENGRIEIAFPRAYRYATYILHELAHYGIGLRDDIAAHGPEFVGYFLALVDEFCSTKTSNAMRRAMAKNKVKIYLPHRIKIEKTIIDLNSYEELQLFDNHGHSLTATDTHSF
jgi:putative metallohydrolase (TIGR04338 family)